MTGFWISVALIAGLAGAGVVSARLEERERRREAEGARAKAVARIQPMLEEAKDQRDRRIIEAELGDWNAWWHMEAHDGHADVTPDGR